MDAVFKALADPSRRRLLDSLNQQNGQSLSDLAVGLTMTRQAVAKHLGILETANLVTIVWRGREKLHYLNAVPINEIAERWIGQYDRARVEALADLKRALEEETMTQPEFVYTTYIKTTPEQLWRALTETSFTRRYFGGGPESDWQVGSPVKWWSSTENNYVDMDQVVLESEPGRRLSYTWHNYQREHVPLFGWTEEQFAEALKEPRGKVTFEIEPAGEAVKLTVIHEGLAPDGTMRKAISWGWPQILSNLKTMLETGETMAVEEAITVGDAVASA